MGAWMWAALAAAVLWVLSRSDGSDSDGGGGDGQPFTSDRIVNRDGRDITGNFSEDERQFAGTVEKYADRWNVPPELALATLADESDGDPYATNVDDEVGLFQLTPGAVQDVVNNTSLTWASGLSARTPGNVEQNTQFGVAYLWLQNQRYQQAGDGNWFDTLRAYVCGYEGSRRSPQCAADDARDRMELAGWSR